MQNIDFTEHYLPKIKAVINSAVNSDYSFFYNKKYKNILKEIKNINSIKDFGKIPLLTKDEILNTKLKDRIFVPTTEIDKYTFSSGTTNHLRPLAMPHSISQNADSARKEHILELATKGYKNFLFLLNPFHGMINPGKSSFQGKIVTIIGDIHNLKKTAILINELELHGIFTTAAALDIFIPELEKNKFNFNTIKFISLGGEFCSGAKRDYFKNIFKNAEIEIRYGSSEIDKPRGYQCKYLYSGPTTHFHVSTDKYYIEESENGELIHTDLETNKAFPLIRYKTGDIGEISNKECPCGNSSLLILGGRNGFDVLKFSGFILRSDVLSNILSPWHEVIGRDFTAHVYEISMAKKVLPQIILEVRKEASEKELEVIRKSVSEKLLLSPHKNLDYFIKRGRILPLKISISNDKTKTVSKTRNIVSHI